ncbi:MAG TPA: hypothetical protein VK784_05000, partial [Pseudonocardiaceae bacterium]|nr:hypothetical protein [Pseudonocardiaceae bacterium]
MARLSSPVRLRLAIRSAVDSRVNRTGLAMINPISMANSRLGSSHRDCRANLSGSATCNPMATTIATATGHRLSPRVTRRQAGMCTWFTGRV